MGYLDIDLPPECILDICIPGDNMLSVQRWVNILGSKLKLKHCKKLVIDSGIDRASFKSIDYKLYGLWIEAWNQFDFCDY